MLIPEEDQVSQNKTALAHLNLPSPRLSYFTFDKPDSTAGITSTYFTHELLEIVPQLYSTSSKVNTTYYQQRFDAATYRVEPFDKNELIRRSLNNRRSQRCEIVISHLARTSFGRFKSEKEKFDHAVSQFADKVAHIDKLIAQTSTKQGLDPPFMQRLCVNSAIRAYIYGEQHVRNLILRRKMGARKV